ncbi:VOC family protein [Methanosarcina sp. UBA5]|uniref:VOC family protein n=1 Tax=Methanosarcina sp. UBA5 TaxID=1915593 RepID=UPI0025FB118C|nr:VOC family protein [Methanosarcina sp. UBA5]
MIEDMTHVMLFVKDYNEALDFYTNKLGFVKVTDVSPVPGWRFLSVAPNGQGTEIILHVPNPAMQGEAEAKRETELIGKTPALIFKVDDCKKTCDELRAKGVTIVEEPGEAPYGIQAHIVDLYGNPLWLIEPPR